MKIEQNKVVSLTYELKLNDANGQLVEKVEREQPFQYLARTGGLLPAFEDNLEGLEVGAPFAFTLTPENGYGNPHPEMIVDVPRNIFVNEEGQEDAEILKEGAVLPMQDDQGNVLQGRIISISTDQVKMDFNHPLAGQTLHFQGEVVEVREASQEELDHGHAHGPEGHVE